MACTRTAWLAAMVPRKRSSSGHQISQDVALETGETFMGHGHPFASDGCGQRLTRACIPIDVLVDGGQLLIDHHPDRRLSLIVGEVNVAIQITSPYLFPHRRVVPINRAVIDAQLDKGCLRTLAKAMGILHLDWSRRRRSLFSWGERRTLIPAAALEAQRHIVTAGVLKDGGMRGPIPRP
jgi:hypothetical protein